MLFFDKISRLSCSIVFWFYSVEHIARHFIVIIVLYILLLVEVWEISVVEQNYGLRNLFLPYKAAVH